VTPRALGLRRDGRTPHVPMLTAKPTGLLSSDFHLARDGRPLATLRQSAVREKATVTLDGVEYDLRNQLLGRDFLLRREGRLLARADKRAFRYAFDVTVGPEGPAPRTFRYASVGLLVGGRFRLTEGERTLGEAAKVMLGRTARTSFPDAMPLELEVFLLWIALMMWRRDRNG